MRYMCLITFGYFLLQGDVEYSLSICDIDLVWHGKVL